jgi:hypothetical protein
MKDPKPFPFITEYCSYLSFSFCSSARPLIEFNETARKTSVFYLKNSVGTDGRTDADGQKLSKVVMKEKKNSLETATFSSPTLKSITKTGMNDQTITRL